MLLVLSAYNFDLWRQEIGVSTVHNLRSVKCIVPRKNRNVVWFVVLPRVSIPDLHRVLWSILHLYISSFLIHNNYYIYSRQFSSSEPSLQSWCLSQKNWESIQVPSRHWNWFSLQPTKWKKKRRFRHTSQKMLYRRFEVIKNTHMA